MPESFAPLNRGMLNSVPPDNRITSPVVERGRAPVKFSAVTPSNCSGSTESTLRSPATSSSFFSGASPVSVTAETPSFAPGRSETASAMASSVGKPLVSGATTSGPMCWGTH